MSESRADIVLFISDLGSGGAQRVLCALAAHWTGAGRRAAVVTLAPDAEDFFRLPPGVERIALGMNRESGSLAGAVAQNLTRIRRLRRELRRLRPDVAIGFIGPAAVLLVAAAAGTGIRTIAAERNDPARQSFGRIWDALRRRAYHAADRVTFNAPGAEQALRAFVPSDRLMFTPNPVPSPVAGDPADVPKPCILAVGRLHPQKGIDLLIEAFAALDAPDWHLVLVGEGAQRNTLMAQVRGLGLEARVRFTGAVDDPSPYYRAADIFAMPSRHEGTPNALMEAMSHGLAAVISDTSPGPLALIEDGENGLVAPTATPGALAAALQRLIDDAGLRARLGAGARAAMDRRRAQDDAFARWDAAIAFGSGAPAQ